MNFLPFSGCCIASSGSISKFDTLFESPVSQLSNNSRIKLIRWDLVLLWTKMLKRSQNTTRNQSWKKVPPSSDKHGRNNWHPLAWFIYGTHHLAWIEPNFELGPKYFKNVLRISSSIFWPSKRVKIPIFGSFCLQRAKKLKHFNIKGSKLLDNAHTTYFSWLDPPH